MKLNEFIYLHSKWLHLVTGSFKTNAHAVFWRFDGKPKRKIKKIFQGGGEKKLLITQTNIQMSTPRR